MQKDIWEGCMVKRRCSDTSEASLLLEAHVFESVKMDKDIQSLRLSRRTKDGQLDESEWELVKENAYEWAKRNHVAVYLKSD